MVDLDVRSPGGWVTRGIVQAVESSALASSLGGEGESRWSSPCGHKGNEQAVRPCAPPVDPAPRRFRAEFRGSPPAWRRLRYRNAALRPKPQTPARGSTPCPRGSSKTLSPGEERGGAVHRSNRSPAPRRLRGPRG